ILDEKWVDDYLLEVSKVREMPIENLDGYKQSYMYFLNSMDENAKIEFAKNMTFLSSGVLIGALADAKIDACPMFGFDKKSYDEILGLDKEGFTTEFIIAIGYRHADDEYQNYKKVRFSKDVLVKKF
ncbi:NAD(P)H-dependent oxidoreductase, partial [Candidatus Gracilibacteria bacterium]|nr:NAD(P)H-dependent oxidoreductase [Candidatus Gracilibacteria bacterium]